MPGSGKSTVGRQLAKQLGLGFVDSDTELERRVGMPIREWFARFGEDAFRDLEQDIIDDVTCRADTVIATGGGAVLRPSNRDALHARTHVFYLRTTPEELFRRLRHDSHRPLLQVEDPLARLRQLFKDRDPLYRRVAHFVVEGGRPAMTALLGMVLSQIENAGLREVSTKLPETGA